MVKNPPANADVRDKGSIPGSGRSPGQEEGYGNLLQYSCLENTLDRQVMGSQANPENKEELGEVKSILSQRVRHKKRLHKQI